MACPCCQCSCHRTVTYSYYDSVPPGKYYTECPKVGKCDGTDTGDCAGDVLEGFIVERFKKSCVRGSTIRAKLKAGSYVDDYGTIGGVSTTNNCGALGAINEDHDISDQVVIEDDGDYVKAKIPISITNDEYLGGPHGLASVTICWCCDTGSDCWGCFPVCCCEDGIGTQKSEGSCSGTTFEAPSSYDYSSILGSLIIEWCGLTISGLNDFDSQSLDVVKCQISTAGTEHEGRQAYLKVTSKNLSCYQSSYSPTVCGFSVTGIVTVYMSAEVRVVYPEYPGWDPVWRYATTTEYYEVDIAACNNGTSPLISVTQINTQSGNNECGDPMGCYQPCNRTPPVAHFAAAP